MTWRVLLPALLSITAAIDLPRCAPQPPKAFELLADYKPYNLRLLTTDLEFWLDYTNTRVQTNLTVSSYTGGDIILNGSDLINLDELAIVFDRTIQNARYALKRLLTKAVCLTESNDLIIRSADLPSGLENGFIISITNHFNPEENSHLFGLYRSRNLLVTQNESSGFRRIAFYPDRPDVLSKFTTIIHADAATFPVLLSNGNLISQESANGVISAIYHDPYPKPSYLFALVAGPLVSISREVVLGQNCWSALQLLVGSEYSQHSLAAYCSNPSARYEDVVISRKAVEESPSDSIFKLASRKSASPDEITASIASAVKRKISNFPDYVSSLFSGASDKLAEVWAAGGSRGAVTAEGQKTLASADAVVETGSSSAGAGSQSSEARVSPGLFMLQPNTNTTSRWSQFRPWSTAVSSGQFFDGDQTTFCPATRNAQDWSGIRTYLPAGDQTFCPYKVQLRVWAERDTVELSQLEWALKSVHEAMLYDEVRFGRYYDLSEFSVVACRDFNAGAMENKGLNIFNEALILADNEITTDNQFERIRGVIAHEYFHNWSGDRVTVRDWFQLTLKEGLTVFRDQSFTNDLSQSSLMKRLRDIDLIETAQFTQDATPMSHPIRPSKYQTVENFYTVTVYEKGAEVIRMYETLLGPVKFRAATDRFFDQNVDRAATCEDFLAAVKAVDVSEARAVGAPQVDWDQFFLWYSTPGTPVVKVTAIHWSSTTRMLRLRLEQGWTRSDNDTATQHSPTPALVIPVRLSLIDPTDHSRFVDNYVYVLSRPVEEIVFPNIARRPIISLFRGFSAPVRVESFQSDQDLAYLATHDDDAYVRFKSLDQLISNEVRKCFIKTSAHYRQQSVVNDEFCPLRSGLVTCEISPLVLSVYQELFDRLTAEENPSSIYAQLLSLPRISRLKTSMKPFEPARVNAVIKNIRAQLIDNFGDVLINKYIQLDDLEPHGGANSDSTLIYDHSPTAVSRRAVKNAILALLLSAGSEMSVELGLRQLRKNAHANDVSATLLALSASGNDPDVQIILSDWLRTHQHHSLHVDRWFSAQMGWLDVNCFDRFEALMKNPLYAESRTPNRLRSLMRSFASNPVAFHQQRAYELVATEIIRWDSFNPKLAAGLATAFSELSLVTEALKADGLMQLDRILAADGLSKNTREIVSSIKEKTILVS